MTPLSYSFAAFLGVFDSAHRFPTLLSTGSFSTTVVTGPPPSPSRTVEKRPRNPPFCQSNRRYDPPPPPLPSKSTRGQEGSGLLHPDYPLFRRNPLRVPLLTRRKREDAPASPSRFASIATQGGKTSPVPSPVPPISTRRREDPLLALGTSFLLPTSPRFRREEEGRPLLPDSPRI